MLELSTKLGKSFLSIIVQKNAYLPICVWVLGKSYPLGCRKEVRRDGKKICLFRYQKLCSAPER